MSVWLLALKGGLTALVSLVVYALTIVIWDEFEDDILKGELVTRVRVLILSALLVATTWGLGLACIAFIWGI